jgi:hypothetical protein
MLTHLLAAHPTMTLERGPVLGCIELGSAGGTAALLRMRERGATRSRAGGRLILVRSESLHGNRWDARIRRDSGGTASVWRPIGAFTGRVVAGQRRRGARARALLCNEREKDVRAEEGAAQ